MNNAAINVGEQISLQDPDFSSFKYIPKSGIAGSYGSSIFNRNFSKEDMQIVNRYMKDAQHY